MTHLKKYTQDKRENKIIYGDGIVDGIVLLAVNELDNVELYSKSPNKKNRSSAIKVNFGKNGIEIDVDIKMNFHQCVSDVAFRVQEQIRHNVEAMTDYHIDSVNVHVKNVSFSDVSTPVVSSEE